MTRASGVAGVARGGVLHAARRGVTLVLVVMLLVLLQVAVMGTVTSSARQVDLMTVEYQGVQASYTAEGLLARGIREAVRNTDEDGDGTIGTVSAGAGGTLTRTTSGSDSILTGSVTAGDVTRSLRYRWTVSQPMPAGGSPLLEAFTVATTPATLSAIGWSGTAAAIGTSTDVNFASLNAVPLWRGGPILRFGARITGLLTVTLPGTYSFGIESDDGSDLAISGSTVVSHDGPHSMTLMSGSTVLSAGTYPFVARVFQGSGSNGLRMYWQPPGSGALTLVPRSALSGSGASRGVTVHSWLSLKADSQLIGWARSGSGGGVTAVVNATTNDGSTLGIDLRDQSVLLGDVQVGVGSTVATVLRQYGTAAWTGSGSALAVAAAIERVSMPVLPGGTLGAVALSGTTAVTYGPGTVRCTSLTMSGDSVATISGETVLIVDGALTMSEQAKVQLATGASLRLYVGGNATVSGTAQINGTSSRSPDLWMSMTAAAAPTLALSDSAVFCGNVQNPGGTVALTSAATLHGTIEADTVTLDNQARVYADVSAVTSGVTVASATLVYFSDLTLPN
jgi:hypothetical protein